MRVEVRRTGGFAGIARAWSIDTAKLPPERAAQIERAIERMTEGRSSSPDAFAYEVIIDGKRREVADAEELIAAIG